MRKLLVLIFVAALCVPGYGSILVYRTSVMDTVFSGNAPTKETLPGYLILNVNLDTQVVSDAQHLTYTIKPTKTQETVNVTVNFNSSGRYIVAEYARGNADAILSGKTYDGNAVGLTGKQVAKSLKGYLLVSSESSFLMGSGTISATLDTKWTKDNLSSDVPTVAGLIAASLTKYTVVSDTTAPTPNPMTWAIAPTVPSDTQITMTATTATDYDTPHVEYYFTNVTDTSHNSGWQTSATFIDSDLTPDTDYTYNVMARDSASPVPNVTAVSTPDVTVTTNKTADTNAPEPNIMTWATVPTAVSDTVITMTATTATDTQGPVQYYFTNKNDPNGHNSGWMTSTIFTDTGLTPDTNYGYTVKARDNALARNVTAESNEANAVTFSDTTCPGPINRGSSSRQTNKYGFGKHLAIQR